MQDNIFSLKANLPYYLQSKGVDVQKASRSNTACPICGGGTRTGCFHYYLNSQKVKCYSCGFHGDLFDLIAKEMGISISEAIAIARRMYGNEQIPNAPVTESAQSTFNDDYTSFLLRAEKNNNYEYLLQRGISVDTQRKFHIGFVYNWKSPKAIARILGRGGNIDNLPSSPRCIIPRNQHNYLARDTRSNIPASQHRYEKQNTGCTSLFNVDALKEDVVFITEGEIDAMSIVEVGENACALCSISNVQLLLKHLKQENLQEKVVILMLDNDKAGLQTTKALSKKLGVIGVKYIIAEYPMDIKDPNQWLMINPEEMKKSIFLFKAKAQKIMGEQKSNKYNAVDVLNYFKTIDNQPEAFEAKTGFDELDKHLGGGLHEGLYIIGAISSLGKTTFTLQLADQVAERGEDVIFFSLEMSKYEIVAKSISRYTYEWAGNTTIINNGITKPLARNTLQILNNRHYQSYNTEEREIIQRAIWEYEKRATNISIYEGRYKGARLKVSHIREIVEQHIHTTNNKPIIFVDYLQIIAPSEVNANDKQNIDNIIYELKEISRDYHIPVVVVSSFNRNNYNEPVSMQSFKESGAIEYSSDVLLGLQYAGMDYQEGEGKESRVKRLREMMKDIFRKKQNREVIEVELKCLKQRTGYQFSIDFAMIPAYNYFSFLGHKDKISKNTEYGLFENMSVEQEL